MVLGGNVRNKDLSARPNRGTPARGTASVQRLSDKGFSPVCDTISCDTMLVNAPEKRGRCEMDDKATKEDIWRKSKVSLSSRLQLGHQETLQARNCECKIRAAHPCAALVQDVRRQSEPGHIPPHPDERAMEQVAEQVHSEGLCNPPDQTDLSRHISSPIGIFSTSSSSLSPTDSVNLHVPQAALAHESAQGSQRHAVLHPFVDVAAAARDRGGPGTSAALVTAREIAISHWTEKRGDLDLSLFMTEYQAPKKGKYPRARRATAGGGQRSLSVPDVLAYSQADGPRNSFGSKQKQNADTSGCSGRRITSCGCGECDPDSELDEDEAKAAAEALFEEARQSRRRVMQGEDVEDEDGKHLKIAVNIRGGKLVKCSSCLAYKKRERFNGGTCTGCIRRKKWGVDVDEPQDIDAIISRCCREKKDFCSDAEGQCSVCNSTDFEDGDWMVQCEGCKMWVHCHCYGGELIKPVTAAEDEWESNIPEDDWFCQVCVSTSSQSLGNMQVTCVLCPVRHGALKRTIDGRWVHLHCMRITPETEAKHVYRQEPIDGICDISWKKWSLKCMVCGTSAGACIICEAKDCNNSFHVGCAQNTRGSKFHMDHRENGNGPLIWTRYCSDHAHLAL